MTTSSRANALVEVAPGRLKPFKVCTPAERRRASRIIEQKNTLMNRHRALLRQIDEDQVPQDAWPPLTFKGFETGVFPPLNVTLPELQAEVDGLERILDEGETN